ncbi:hypothetical protein ENBRE01_2082 [Enteropsectra breve]|nr:hypothetical protein ENBRE01_2082 [Enteropsectra breve]
MFDFYLLMQWLWPAEQAVEAIDQQRTDDDRLFEEIRLNGEEIRKAREKWLTKVNLPCPMPKIKQLYNPTEYKELLEQKNNAVPENTVETGHSDESAESCIVCYQSFLREKTFENSFQKGVYETHNLLPVYVLCPNPRCNDGRVCPKCLKILIRRDIMLSPFKATVEYFDNQNTKIPYQRMFECLVCRNYLNIELADLEAIPESCKLNEPEKGQYIEDLVYNQDKTYWFLEIVGSLHTEAFARLDTAMKPLIIPNPLNDASQNFLSYDLAIQYIFYAACTQQNIPFDERIILMKGFLRTCTEKISFPFITKLINFIEKLKLSPNQLESFFKEICAEIPIENADNFSLLYYSLIKGYFRTTKDANLNRLFIKKWMISIFFYTHRISAYGAN